MLFTIQVRQKTENIYVRMNTFFFLPCLDLSGEFSGADVRRHGSSRDLDHISVFSEATANGNANGSYRRTSRPNEPKNYEVIGQ